MNPLVVFNGLLSRFKIVTVPVYCFWVHQLGPSPFFQLGLLENLLKKTELVKTNLWAPSTCRERRQLEEELQWTGMKRIIKIWTGAYEMNVSLPKLCQWACIPSPLDGSSIGHPLGRINDSSSLYLSWESQR